jgi:hypothetical protein
MKPISLIVRRRRIEDVTQDLARARAPSLRISNVRALNDIRTGRPDVS